MQTRWIIGLSSGSSAEGVEAVVAEIEGTGLDLRARLVQSVRQSLGPDLRELIRKASTPGPCEVRQVCQLHRLLGESFAAAARAVADQGRLSLQKVLCVGWTGQTLWHEVEGRFPATLNLGMPAVVAERLGVTTVSDFHGRDLAAGGMGLPLEPLADYLLFRHAHESRRAGCVNTPVLILHLNSVARVAWLPAGGRVQDVLAFEAGPCNGLLDALMRQMTGGREPYDAGGKHAVQGKCLEPLLQSWMAHPYFQRRPPKCLPRHSFGDDFALHAVRQTRQGQGCLHDLLCTATHFVARGITTALKRLLPDLPERILVSGGGARNGFLWHLLEQQLQGRTLQRTDEVGVPGTACKAMAAAVLAALTLDGVAGNLPSATGAAGSRLLGSLTPGSASNWARCLSWMAAQNAPVVIGQG
jgi:anhydro-N-acetylmuramic acid kinase